MHLDIELTADRIFYVCGKKMEIALLKAFDSIIDSHQSQDLRIVLLQIMHIITVIFKRPYHRRKTKQKAVDRPAVAALCLRHQNSKIKLLYI